MAFSDFLTGAYEAGSGILDEKRKSALEIKMLSRKIELEQEAKQGQFEYEKMPQEAQNEALGKLGYTKQFPRLSVGQMGQMQAGPKLESMESRAKSRQKSRLQTKTIGDGPDTKIIWVDPENPGKVQGELRVGKNPSMIKQYERVASDYASSKAVFDSIDDAVEGLLNDKDLISRYGNTASLKIQDLLSQGDERVIDLIGNRKGYAIQLAASINGGRPSEPDAKAIELMLPSEFDSLKFAQGKLSRLDKFLKAKEDSSYKILMQGDLSSGREDSSKNDISKDIEAWEKSRKKKVK